MLRTAAVMLSDSSMGGILVCSLCFLQVQNSFMMKVLKGMGLWFSVAFWASCGFYSHL